MCCRLPAGSPSDRSTPGSNQQFLVSGPGVSEQVSALDVGKLILVFRSIPDDDIKLRELLERFGLVERFTPYVAGGPRNGQR